MTRARAALFALALLAIGPAYAQVPPPAPAYVMIGQTAPRFSIPLAGGGALTDGDFLRKWTVVEFWALWCEDSIADLKYARALDRAVAQDPSLRFVTIHVDQRYGRWTSVEAFMSDEGLAYPVALDPHRDVMRAFQLQSTPVYLIIDTHGVIRAIHYDLRKDPSPDGGVKALIKHIHNLRMDDNVKQLRRF